MIQNNERTEYDSESGWGGAIEQSFAVPFEFPICFTRNAFASDNPLLLDLIESESERPARIWVCIDQGVAEAWPLLGEEIRAFFEPSKSIYLCGAPEILPGGEKAKDGLGVVETIGRHAVKHGLDRHAYVLAIGGGAFLDAVGLGVGLIHRGLRLLRMPTTVLAQNDAGIGVKNGVNAFGQKNFFGMFAPAAAVVNDSRFLTTLEDRDWRAGIAEAVKVASIKFAPFLKRIQENADALQARDLSAMEDLVWHCAKLHANHTATSGDPFEFGSARPLDFGHWSAHWMENASGWRLNHGEAVAIGIALDTEYAVLQGYLVEEEAVTIQRCLYENGLPVWDDLLDALNENGELSVLQGLEQFREHLGGELSLTFPNPIGSIKQVNEIDSELMMQAIANLKARVASIGISR